MGEPKLAWLRIASLSMAAALTGGCASENSSAAKSEAPGSVAKSSSRTVRETTNSVAPPSAEERTPYISQTPIEWNAETVGWLAEHADDRPVPYARQTRYVEVGVRSDGTAKRASIRDIDDGALAIPVTGLELAGTYPTQVGRSHDGRTAFVRVTTKVPDLGFSSYTHRMAQVDLSTGIATLTGGSAYAEAGIDGVTATLRGSTADESNRLGAWLMLDLVFPSETRSIPLIDNQAQGHERLYNNGMLRFLTPTTLAVTIEEMESELLQILDLRSLTTFPMPRWDEASAHPMLPENASATAVIENGNGGRIWLHEYFTERPEGSDSRPIFEDKNGQVTRDVRVVWKSVPGDLDPEGRCPQLQIDTDHWVSGGPCPPLGFPVTEGGSEFMSRYSLDWMVDLSSPTAPATPITPFRLHVVDQ